MQDNITTVTISLQIQNKTETSKEKSISLDRLIYLTENIDLDITEECHTVVVTNIPVVLEESVLRFISARVDYLISERTCKELLVTLKKGI